MNKKFNGRKYYLNRTPNRWFRTTHPQIKLSHDVWNYYHPGDQIKEDAIIHHVNKDKSRDL